MLTDYRTAELAGRPGIDHPADHGPALLASVSLSLTDVPRPLATATATRWLGGQRAGFPHGGLFGAGLAGTHLGLLAAADVVPALRRADGLVARTRGALAAYCARRPWRTESLAWNDYDLATGPAGAVLALAADPGADRAVAEPAVAHLVRLAGSGDLRGFRLGANHGTEVNAWNRGRINAGVCHGVAGVAVALCAFADRFGLDRATAGGLRRIADWLAREAYRDESGFTAWPSSGRDGPVAELPSRRQAWCYGTPGVAWCLWEAGRVLGDAELRLFASAAFASFLAVPGANHNPTPAHAIAVCHGDAGLMVLCDAFARHVGTPGAAGYRDRLAESLLDRLDAAPPWPAPDFSLLSGPVGVLTALVAVCTGDLSGLACLGVR